MNISYGGPHIEITCPGCVDYIGTVEFLRGGTVDLYRHLESENGVEDNESEYSVEWAWVHYPTTDLTDEDWEELDKVVRIATSIVRRIPMESLFHKPPTRGELEDE
jgi:hypothetical protein